MMTFRNDHECAKARTTSSLATTDEVASEGA